MTNIFITKFVKTILNGILEFLTNFSLYLKFVFIFIVLQELLLRRARPGPQHPDQRPVEPQTRLKHPPGVNFTLMAKILKS